MPVDEQKFAEHIFNGSLAVQVILIAVVGIVAVSYEKVAALPEVEPKFKWFLWGLAGLSALGCVLTLLAVPGLRGRPVSSFLIIPLLHLLIVGTAVAAIGLVMVTVF